MNRALKIWKVSKEKKIPPSSEKVNYFKTEMEVYEAAPCHHTYTYLLNRTLHIQIIGLLNTAQLNIYISCGRWYYKYFLVGDACIIIYYHLAVF